MISKNHKNRKAHNWLVYDINDRFLEKYIPLYTGILYDLGAGESPYKAFFLKYANSYVAVDWSESLHDTKADIIADLNKKIRIDSGVADTIVSLSVLEHLSAPWVFLNEAFRILKNGGRIVLQVPFQWHVHEAPYDYYRYTPYGIKYLFMQAGFENISIEPTSGIFTTIILKMNYFTYRYIRGPRPLRLFLRGILTPFWYIAQKIAPILDTLDRNHVQESQGYFVTAQKF